ncbi:MAG: transposase [Sulfurimonadaceae bacterium]|jgi:REP element-mobilizing transposase RayT|nr:transposase [Sulfurimonadaceae bacterium]
MPTRLRVDLAGYHHVINRGVNRSVVFNSPDDKELFLQIINKSATIHKVILHDYCIMDNHYHLLIETQKENISTFMRIVNANYAKYYNKKYKRSGHLWQDRYKSRYITCEDYLYILIRYIENNPIEAGLSHKVSKYPFTLASILLKAKEHYPCSNESLLKKEFDIKTLAEFLDASLSQDELEFLQEKEKQKVVKSGDGIMMKRSKKFEEHFMDAQTKQERNVAILNAYLDGYSQVDIATYLKLSNSMISKVVKSGDSLTGV